MASSFLERKAKEREEVLRSQYGENEQTKTVDNDAIVKNQTTGNRVSSFLERKANERQQILTNRYGSSAISEQEEQRNKYSDEIKKRSLLSSSEIYMDGLRSAGAKDPTVGNQQSEYERLSTYDVNAGKAKLSELRKKLESSKNQWESDLNSETNMWTDDHAFQSYKRQNEELKSQILKLERELNQAERFQKAKSYDVYREEQDFADFSKAGSSKKKSKGFSFFEQGDDRYDYINNIDDYRNTAKAVVSDDNSDNGYYEYDFMSNDEIGIYNYLYAKQGKEAADEYLKL